MRLCAFKQGLTLFAAALTLAHALGCATPRRDIYTVGMYSVATNDMAEVRAAGFNTIRGSHSRQFLDAAHHHGLRVLAVPGEQAGPGFKTEAARKAVAEADGHPALWAWYLSDEPDLNRVSPEDVLTAHQTVKAAGAEKPTAVVLYQGGAGLLYGEISDILMIDRYPVPWLPLASFPQSVRQARMAAGKERPLIAVIQAFDWTYYPKLLPREKNLRPPTRAEMRCMIYSALAQQANGLFFYCYNDSYWRMQEHPETWNALKELVAEVNLMLPLFKAEHVWWGFVQRYGDYETRFNEALEASIQNVRLRVKKGDAFVPAGEYILAVNTTAKAQNCAILTPDYEGASARVFGENRSAMYRENWIADRFEPYQVHIYGPFHLKEIRTEDAPSGAK